MSIARADLTVTAWNQTTHCHFAGFRQHQDVVVKVDDRTFAATGLSLRRVLFAVTVSELIAKIPCIWGEVRPRQQHSPAGKN
jgi:hypothetical protein